MPTLVRGLAVMCALLVAGSSAGADDSTVLADFPASLQTTPWVVVDDGVAGDCVRLPAALPETAVETVVVGSLGEMLPAGKGVLYRLLGGRHRARVRFGGGHMRFADLLAAQREDGSPIYYGDQDLVQSLRDVPVDDMPWKAYNLGN